METLAVRLADPSRGPLPLAEAAGWLARLAKSLDALHAVGRAHGSLSPASLAMAESSPFGAGALLVGDSQDNVLYRSPERGPGGSPSPADDRWAWAVLLHVAIVGAPPTAGLPALAEYPGVQAFLSGCLSPEAARRPQHTAELWDAMERLLGLAGTLAPLDVPAPLGFVVTGGAAVPSSPTYGGGRLALGGVFVVALLTAIGLGGTRATRDKLAASSSTTDEPASTVLSPYAPATTLAAPALSADAPELRDVKPVDQCLERGVGAAPREDYAQMCNERDALALLASVRGIVKGTPAQRTWEALGWYDLAAVVTLQARCCPLVLSPKADAPDACPLEDKLRGLQIVAKRRAPAVELDAALVEATDAYGAAATCSLRGYSASRKTHRATITAEDRSAFLAFARGLSGRATTAE